MLGVNLITIRQLVLTESFPVFLFCCSIHDDSLEKGISRLKLLVFFFYLPSSHKCFCTVLKFKALTKVYIGIHYLSPFQKQQAIEERLGMIRRTLYLQNEVYKE